MTPSNRRFLHLSYFACALSLAGSSLAAVAADEAFAKKAGMGGAGEVAAGKLAQDKGSTDAVKQFGAKMVEDHTQAGDQLKSIADGKKMTVPADPDSAHRSALASLDKKSGAGFDKAFKSMMVKDHQATIALFQQEAKNGKDADLKAFAAKTLPTLQDHLQMARSM